MKRIYLLDDHAIVRDGLRSMLEAAGYEVVGETGDPTAALADLLRLRPDLVLLDLSLENHSGLELLMELKRRALALPCLVLTMSGQPRHVAEALRLGAMGYLRKGSTRSEMLVAVEAVLAGRRYLAPDVAPLAAQALASDGEDDPLSTLSPREQQIIRLVVRGQTSASIGEQFHLSPKTVDTYRSRLMAKLGVSDLPSLVRFAIRVGLVDAEGDI